MIERIFEALMGIIILLIGIVIGGGLSFFGVMVMRGKI